MEFQVKPSSTNAGTAKKPKITSLQLTIKGDTTDGTGQPATSTGLNFTLPKQWVTTPSGGRGASAAASLRSTRTRPRSPAPRGRRSAVAGRRPRSTTAHESELERDRLRDQERRLGPVPQERRRRVGERDDRRQHRERQQAQCEDPAADPGAVPGPAERSACSRSSCRRRRFGGKRIGIVETTGCKLRKWKFTLLNICRDGRNTDTDPTQ